jgi:membrane-associated phospholipid phosphatase
LISIITVVPIVAAGVVTAIYLADTGVFHNRCWYLFSLVFLTLIPISAYALKAVLPAYKNKGRSGERKLAFIFGTASFVLGTAFCFIFQAPVGVRIIFLSYLISSVLLSISNTVIGLKSSGHACGVSGPFLLLVFFLGFKLWWAFLLLLAIFWSRLKMGRHTIKELLSGALIGFLSTALVIFIFTYK